MQESLRLKHPASTFEVLWRRTAWTFIFASGDPAGPTRNEGPCMLRPLHAELLSDGTAMPTQIHCPSTKQFLAAA